MPRLGDGRPLKEKSAEEEEALWCWGGGVWGGVVFERQREVVLRWRGQGWGERPAKGGPDRGCVGRAVKDEGVRERQHLDSELFPCKCDLFSLRDVCGGRSRENVRWGERKRRCGRERSV